MTHLKNKIKRHRVIGIVILTISLLASFISYSQYKKSELPPPPPAELLQAPENKDSSTMHFPVQTTIPIEYDDYVGGEHAADLRTPSNITTEAEYDPATGMYIIRTKVGNFDIVTPYMMTADQYNKVVGRNDMIDYYHTYPIIMNNTDLI